MNMYNSLIGDEANNLERKQMLEMLLSELDGMVYRCMVDEHWTMEFVSDGCLELVGYPPEALLGNAQCSYESITHPLDRKRVREQIDEALGNSRAFNVEYRIVHADGSIKWVWERGSALEQPDGQPVMIHGFIQDITQRFLNENALREAEQRYRSIFENANEGIFQTSPQGQYLEVNPALASIYGYASPAELISAFDNIGTQLYVEPNRRRQFIELLRLDDSVINFESQVYRKDRSIIWISENAHVINDAEGNILYYEGTVEDITERKTYEQRMDYQANHDLLTGLPNRALLENRINDAIDVATSNGSSFAVAFMDLDHFKSINDTMGHAHGDQLIRKLAWRVKKCLRATDTLARIGGDEFILLLPDATSDPDKIPDLLNRVLSTVRSPCQVGQREFTLGCSIGLSIFPYHGKDANTLLKHADIAMYHAKECGRNNFQLFTKTLNLVVQEKHELEHQLRKAIFSGELELHFQPIVEAGSGRLVKSEALVRWNHPRLGLIAPSQFIPVAENTGLIDSLGEWVLESVCSHLSRWLRLGFPAYPVSMNISPRQFNQPDLVPMIRSALERNSLSASMLEIEITESCLARDKFKFLETLGEMKALGLKVMIDDFGSGYSNMGSLKSMHFSSLKVDRSFISTADQEPHCLAIYRAIISMAHTLDLMVVAEGVETLQQAAFLKEIGCDFMQGFHFSHPLDSASFEELLRCMA